MDLPPSPETAPDPAPVADDDAALGALQGKLHRFAVRNHGFIAAFAASKVTKHGDGVLFAFANVGMADLLAEEGDDDFQRARDLERQRVLVHGGITSRAAAGCTMEALRAKMRAETSALAERLTTTTRDGGGGGGGDRESFHLVLAAGMEYATEDVLEALRPPKWNGGGGGGGGGGGKKKKGRGRKADGGGGGGGGGYPGVGGVSVMRLQYGDFRAALTHGLSMNLQDALDVELDREE